MKIGIGLPVDDPDVLHEWAVHADAGPFSTLGLLDRLVWHNPEPLVTLAALAGVTSRIRLQTEVLLAPLRGTALLAKQVATLDRLSRGRFTLGLGIGGRADDHAAAGVDLRNRGRRLDEQLVRMRELWTGATPIGPALASPGGPELLFGAFRPAALARVARFGDGLLCAAPPSLAGDLFRAVERDWAEHGRPGRPRLVAQVNVALGPDCVADDARTAMGAYYGFTGTADRMLAGLLTTPERVRDEVRAYADLGADEVVLYCWATDVTQVDRMADLVS
ncbi:alkanesulfonate monooxygenase SsuD/methylene tetrahydromethanopterin reductase-like flavin-dependent oxidoreductase (luciferase family) [Pseudonocardia hierapolitana]|uniref:Alkanesulfonate monooxygenase SsuD/methylene tetrahydromethanopterin reductase-like flavin-dependent oxidoreductase (Luciferase family) n=1 Tax=Pseudonocardia hierapolitana TaxID=1128676 RepID=A0A561SPT4_9PSEU|nr:LLM class flavin-dependent oxidoreductase [Pseudonocardia hierapolitana]TWF76875.1 alkanesulfonate monooxygenase SsuD/methylene tetrahydromethanopterin reductase-like flavin-dependent oxidoreductase (luciferase family) [Pseudonocardia hierapolitana]